MPPRRHHHPPPRPYICRSPLHRHVKHVEHVKVLNKCEIQITGANDLPTAGFSLSKSTYVEMSHCKKIFKTECDKENVKPVWYDRISLNVNKERFLVFTIKHDGLLYDSAVAYGVFDLKPVKMNEHKYIDILLYETRANARSGIGKIVGNLYFKIIINNNQHIPL